MSGPAASIAITLTLVVLLVILALWWGRHNRDWE